MAAPSSTICTPRCGLLADFGADQPLGLALDLLEARAQHFADARNAGLARSCPDHVPDVSADGFRSKREQGDPVGLGKLRLLD
ncbi:MAG: hypothetical protein LOX97_01985, partial [Sphingomonas sp.]|nr:hypothetical protein [Sphingomonas sp.]